VEGEISMSGDRRTRRPGVTSHRTSVDLHERDRQWYAGVVVSRPAVVIVELAGVISLDALELVLDDALQRRRVTTSSVRDHARLKFPRVAR
jgi:hypothetical protein